MACPDEKLNFIQFAAQSKLRQRASLKKKIDGIENNSHDKK